MTDQENAQFESELDEVIEDKNIEYHYDNFLKNVFGVHDLDDLCDCCKMTTMLAVHKHISDRIDALDTSEGLSN